MSDNNNKTEDEIENESKAENQGLDNNLEENNKTTDAEPLNEVDKLKADVQEAKEKYLRLYAEFENFRRRTAKEKIDNILNASEGLLKEMLPVMDDFERAKKSMDESSDIEAIKEGIDLIFNKFQKTLTSKGLKPMVVKDTIFDAELHECITQFAVGDDKKGLVIEEVEKGYFLNDKVIRYAKVVVGS